MGMMVPWPGRSLANAQMFRRSLLASAADALRSTRSDSRSIRSRSSSRSSSGRISFSLWPTGLWPFGSLEKVVGAVRRCSIDAPASITEPSVPTSFRKGDYSEC